MDLLWLVCSDVSVWNRLVSVLIRNKQDCFARYSQFY